MRSRELSRPFSVDLVARALPRFAQVSLCDVLVTIYYSLLLAVAYSCTGAARSTCILALTVMLVAHLLTVAVIRSRETVGTGGALVYRLVIYFGVQLSYFVLRPLLAMATSHILDARLYQLDLSLFHFEPALFFDRFVSSGTTEWFAFFYFSYFVLLAVHVYPIVFFSKDRAFVTEFLMVMFFVFCVAHCLYIAVPGVGPHRFLASSFTHPLPHGRWYDLVVETVSAGGAQKDIFPSLHTAGPTSIALFSYRHRARLPFRYTWPVVAFFAANIAIATMFLRWHYVIDVIAGVGLAMLATWLAPRLTRWEDARRDRLGFSASLPAIHARR